MQSMTIKFIYGLRSLNMKYNVKKILIIIQLLPFVICIIIKYRVSSEQNYDLKQTIQILLQSERTTGVREG